MIPKIIHWCWFSKEIPAEIQNYVDGWKKLMPDYEIIRWNADNFDIHSVKKVEQAVKTKKWAFAADYIRLWAVYNYGGIYLDSDVEVLKPFDDLLSLPYFLGKEIYEYRLEMAVFGAQKECFWVKDCLEYFKNKDHLRMDGDLDTEVITDTCFHILNKKYGFLPSLPENFDYNSSKINIFPYEYFSSGCYLAKEIYCTKNTYSIHHFNGSWVDDDTIFPHIYIKQNKQKLYLWGAGRDGIVALKQCQKKGLKIEAFLDSKAENGEYVFEGYNCIAPSQVLKKSERDFFIIVSSKLFCREIYKIIKSYGLVENEDFWLPLPSELVDYG
jgi:hypothetical protein